MLNKDFVNAWVLAKDLPKLAEGSKDEDFRKLCATLKEHYSYPVDSITLSPALEVLEQRTVEELMVFDANGYVAFLEQATAKFRGPAPSGR